MKKRIMCLCLALLVLCLFGCSKPISIDTVNEQKPTPSGLAPDVPEDGQNTLQDEQAEYMASDEIVGAGLFGNVIQVGNTVISLPAQYTDFISAGAILVSNNITEDYLMDSGAEIHANMQIADTVFTLEMVNTSEQRCPMKDADVQCIDSTNGPDIFYPGGIHVGSSLSELEEKWGKATEDKSGPSYDTLTFIYLEYPLLLDRLQMSRGASGLISVSGYEYTISIERNSSCIDNIQCKWIDRTMEKEPAVHVSSFYSGKQLSWQRPFVFYQNPIHRVFDETITLFVIDDIPYIISLNTTFFESQQRIVGFKDGLVVEQNDVTVTEELLHEAINGKAISSSARKYDVEIYGYTETKGRAIGYHYSEAIVECKAVYMNNFYCYTTLDSAIIPLNEGDDLTDSAIRKFKELMAEFLLSIDEV